MSPEPKLVLLADDEADIVTVTRMRIELSGYRVATAANGVEALDQARRLMPDIILLDLKMPKLDGYQVCGTEGRPEDRRESRFCLFSASSTYAATLEHECILLGAEGYLHKPFHVTGAAGQNPEAPRPRFR